MSVTRAPRDIAFRLSEKSRASSEGGRWANVILPGVDASARARAWFSLNHSPGNQLISRYLAQRTAKTSRVSAPEFDQADDG